ncbi:MAG TPA: AAA family ATPase [Planctomycetota bacterium]|jgi:DNA repair exonuclease SbcCD ATPase subunit|nr:AAA family ATPase [Planctomycetota bacterium]
MIRLVRLGLRNFRGWADGELRLDRPITLLVGENRRGKSSTVNAIEWCLYGKEIEKKASGIDERADWEVERRGAGDEGVEVGLTIAFEDAEARISRRRKHDAGARDDDELAVELADGRRLVGTEATQWMRERKLPDWDTWRRACCQHQEILRCRLTVADERSLVVSSLLGMEEHDRLARSLKDQQPGKLIGEIDHELGELEKVVLYRLRAPSEDLYESERRLEALGLERARLSPALAVEIGRTAIERARALAGRLGLETALPSSNGEADEAEVKKWADGWIALVRKEAKLSERLQSATKRRAKLAAELDQLLPAEERWRGTKEKLDAEQREKGEHTTQKTLLAESEKAVAEAEAALRFENRNLALLREAAEVLRAGADSDQCPVCDTHVSGLAARIESTVRKGTGERLAALSSERDRARGRRDVLEKSIRDIAKLVVEEKEARKAFEGRRAAIEAIVSPGRIEPGSDLAAAARAEDEALAAEIAGLEASVAGLDAELEEHRKDVERLRELSKWRASAKRAQQRADITNSAEWKVFQEAVDAAAAFAADLDAMAAMARETQEERSAAREAEVNRSLGEYVRLITGAAAGDGAGGDSALDVRVRVKRTPKGLSYDVEDADGERALSILNQASLNAISLAMLFAQAEERARSGLFSVVVLDDPDQSLDDEHKAGLARAIERMAKSAPVVVATTPGPFAERILSHVSTPRRAIRFGRQETRSGARADIRVASQEER